VGRGVPDTSTRVRRPKDVGLAGRLFPAVLVSLAFHGTVALALLAFGPHPSGARFRDAQVPLRMVERARVPAPAAPIDEQTSPIAPPALPSRRPAERRSADAPERATPAEAAREAPSVTEREAPAPAAAQAPAPEGPGLPVSEGTAPAEGDRGGGSGPATGAPGNGTGTGNPGGAGQGNDPARTTVAEGLPDQRMRYGLGVRERLEGARRYPETARRAGRDGTVVLRLHVDADGHVATTSVETPSDWPDLDRAALAAADRLGSLPAPPGGPIDVVVPVRFSLRRP
jgi:protein TonB